jgi:hypothetical protein
VPCPPAEDLGQTYTGPDYILDLATSIAKAALQVNLDKDLSEAARKSLLGEFETQIGAVARRVETLRALVGEDRTIGRRELATFIGGEVRLIAIRLQGR